MKRILATGTVALAGLLTACAGDAGNAGSSTDADDSALTVYATTGYLADTIANLAPDAEITTMVGPGGDPHTYQPSTQDIQALRESDLVFWNGLHLEAQMIDQLESLGDKQLAVGDELPEDLLLDWEDDLFDPHVWNSPEAWSLVVDAVAEQLATFDADGAEDYRANAEDFKAEIEQVATDAENALSDLDAPRILVTGHDAFAYFGETFDLEVRATDFISTEANLSATELSELADYIVDNEVPVIFQDNQANPQAITALEEAVASRGWEVEISDEELFADSLGPEAPVDTYLGVLEHNASTVADALSEN